MNENPNRRKRRVILAETMPSDILNKHHCK